MSVASNGGAAGGPLRSSLGRRQQLRAAIWPVVSYHLALAWSFLCFVAVMALTSNMDAPSVAILAGLAVTTLFGVLIGQGLAFFGVRGWLLLVFWAGCWTFSVAIGVALGDVGAPIALVLFILPMAATGGAWSLATNRALHATWMPLLYATAAVISWADYADTDDNWFAGEKWAVWSAPSLAMMGVTLGLLLLFLVTRESHRLALWQRGPTAPLQPSRAESGAARTRLTPLGALLLLGGALLLTVATALVSPYLWRTAPGGDQPDDDVVAQPAQDDATEEVDPSDGEWAKRVGERMEQATEAAKQAAGVVCPLLTLALLALAGVIAGWRPLRRLLLLRHLREPLWEVSPTTRVEQGWRLVEIALGDVGVHPRPGEDAAALARRARPVLEALSPVEVHGLEDAAAVADRVRFGLGVQPGDVETMTRFARWTVDTVWERLGDTRQLGALYRDLD